jgi:hypothetical protein
MVVGLILLAVKSDTNQLFRARKLLGGNLFSLN